MASLSEALATATQHHRAGRLQPAEQIYRQILAAEPNQPDALHLLGVIASQEGKHELAVEFIQRAIGRQGNVAFFHNSLGGAYRCLRRVPEAVASYRRAVELKPDFAEAHNNLGDALKDQGKLDEALACYRRAVGLKPDFAEAYNNLGNALRSRESLDEALDCYRRALELKPDSPGMYCNLGNTLAAQGKLEEAVAAFRGAIALKPDFAEAYGSLGHALEKLGDLHEAERSFRAALEHNPRYAFAHHQLAEILGGKLPDADLAAQRRLLDDARLTDADRSLSHFRLAWVLDGRGEYAEAAMHLDRAHALQRSEWARSGKTYDPEYFAAVVSRMIAVCTPDFFERVRGFGSESGLPVFIVGLPRSGTTLVEQILAGHSQVFGAGEISLANETMDRLCREGADSIEGLRRLDRQTAERLAAGHLERLRGLHPAALRIVDKRPENYLLLGLLASLFPRAKFIHCRRDVRDTAVSCWMTFFREVRWASDQRHIAARFHDYRRIMDHWRKVLPAPLLEVDYEETVADLEGVARKLVAWCGLEWEPGCLDFHRAKRSVISASLVQVRQPIYGTSVGRWKHYEQSLAPLLAEVESGES